MKLKRKVRRLEQGITMLRVDMSKKLSRIEGLLKVFMKDIGVDVPTDHEGACVAAFKKMLDQIEPPIMLPKAMPEVKGDTIRFRRRELPGADILVSEGLTPTPETIKDFNDDMLCQCPQCREYRANERVRERFEGMLLSSEDVAASLINFPDDPVMWPEDCQVFIGIDPGVEDWSGIAMVRDNPDDAMIDAMTFGTGLYRSFGPIKTGTYFTALATESTVMKALKEMNE